METTTDRIEKKVLLRAPRDRVWHAISDSKQFGKWFGAEFEAPFVAGADMTGRFVPTKMDPAVAERQKQHEGKPFNIKVDRVEPMRIFSMRWHPYSIEPGRDYSTE